MDEQKIKDQLKKLESKAEPWIDRQLERLRASPWSMRIVIVVFLVLMILAVIL